MSTPTTPPSTPAAPVAETPTPTPRCDAHFDYVKTLARATANVKAMLLYEKFIDGNPLENDVPVWMTLAYCEGGRFARQLERELAARDAELARLRERVEQLEMPDMWRERILELLRPIIGKATNDDGADPEAYWIELSADEHAEFVHLIQGDEQLSGSGGNVSAKTEIKQPRPESLADLRAQLAAATERVTALEQDKERLDWLENGRESQRVGESIRFWHRGEVTFRRAIDHAIDAARAQPTTESK